ncbi:MAG: response regulator, partial [Oligoflexus sp.]
MQGELTFDSIVGQGTTFRIRIPRMSESALVSSIPDRKDQVREVHVGAAVPAQDVSSPPVTLQKAGEGWEVFVIDDNEINCEVITEILKNDGYNLDHAVSGRAGLEQMRKKRPHLLLLDMMMPEMSGEDVIKAMREDPLLQEIPVILIT